MKRKIFLIGMVAVSLFLLGCSLAGNQESSQETPNDETSGTSLDASSANYQTFRSDLLGVSFQFPQSFGTEPVQDEFEKAIFIGIDPLCTAYCEGLYLTILKNDPQNPYQYNHQLFKFGKYTPAESEKSSFPDESQPKPAVQTVKDFLVIQKDDSLSGGPLLLIYDQKDTIYEFTLTQPAQGTPSKYPTLSSATDLLKHIVENFEVFTPQNLTAADSSVTETTPVETIGTVAAKEYAFDSCGPVAKYKTATFYADFLAKATALDRFRLPSRRVIGGVTKISENDIKQVCSSKAGGIVIAMVPGQYCELGEILRYDIATKTIAHADARQAKLKRGGGTNVTLTCMPTLSSFGKRRGAIIEVKGGFGDAGCSADSTFAYDYHNNLLDLKKECSRCVDALTDKKEPDQCRNF